MTTPKLGRYELVRKIAEGGMATVYLAVDTASDRQVAVKVMPAKFVDDTQFRIRFEREAGVIAALKLPYVVPVLDYGEVNGRPFLVMDYMPGGTLAERMAAGPMSFAEALAIVRRVGEALDHAHQRGVIHRDLKPENILFDAEGQAVLADFGIAKLLESNASLTGTGLMGTPAYMSPEQVVGKRTIDGRSDQYALAMLLYEMLAGHHPYAVQAASAMDLALRQVSGPVPRLLTGKLGLPPAINGVLGRALAKKPEERYPTIADFIEALENLSGVEVAAAEEERDETAPLAETPVESAPPLTTRPALAGLTPLEKVGLILLVIGVILVCLVALAGGALVVFTWK